MVGSLGSGVKPNAGEKQCPRQRHSVLVGASDVGRCRAVHRCACSRTIPWFILRLFLKETLEDNKPTCHRREQ